MKNLYFGDNLEYLEKFTKEHPDGFVWAKAYNEIIFFKNIRTGTIFLPDGEIDFKLSNT